MPIPAREHPTAFGNALIVSAGVNIWFGACLNSCMLTQALREGQAGDRCKSLCFPW